MTDSYVVYLEGHEEGSPFKHFLNVDDASAWASSAMRTGDADLAKVYRVEAVVDTRKAVAAVKMNAAIYLFTKTPCRSQEEIDRDSQKAFDLAMAESPQAALKFLGLL